MGSPASTTSFSALVEGSSTSGDALRRLATDSAGRAFECHQLAAEFEALRADTEASLRGLGALHQPTVWASVAATVSRYRLQTDEGTVRFAASRMGALVTRLRGEALRQELLAADYRRAADHADEWPEREAR